MLTNDKAGFITRNGKIDPLQAGEVHEQAVYNITGHLQHTVRFRIYKDHLVFESLQKKITYDQRAAMKRIVRNNEVGSMIVSIDNDWQEFSDFRQVKACVLDTI